MILLKKIFEYYMKYLQKIGIYILIARKRKKLFISIEHYVAISLVLIYHLGFIITILDKNISDFFDIDYLENKKIYDISFISILLILTSLLLYKFIKYKFNKRIILKLYKHYFDEPDPMGKAVLYAVVPNLTIFLVLVLIAFISY